MNTKADLPLRQPLLAFSTGDCGYYLSAWTLLTCNSGSEVMIQRDMSPITEPCEGGGCEGHYHMDEPMFVEDEKRSLSEATLISQNKTYTQDPAAGVGPGLEAAQETGPSTPAPDHDKNDRGFRRIIRNFTPSYVSFSSGNVLNM